MSRGYDAPDPLPMNGANITNRTRRANRCSQCHALLVRRTMKCECGGNARGES